MFNLLVGRLATSLRAAVLGVRLVDWGPFRHVCQLYADDLVILAGSQAHLQHGFGRRACVGSLLEVLVWCRAPPNLRLWSSVPSAADQIVPCILGGVSLPLVPQYGYSVSLSLPLSLGVFTWTWCALVVISSSTRPAPGVVAKVCPLFLLICIHYLRPFQFVIWSGVRRRRLRSTLATEPSLRRWCRSLLGWPSASPVAAVYWEFGVGEALRFALGRAFSLFGRLCAMDHSSSPPPVPASVFPYLFHRARRSVLRFPSQFDILATLAFPWAPLLRPSDVGSLEKPFPAWTATSAAGVQPWFLTCMACLSMSRADNFLLARDNPIYTFNPPPSAVRLWGLARWGHDLSSTGSPSRHRLGPSTCPFCHDADGSLAHHMSSCPAHVNARAVWASCGVSPPDVPTLARHGWVFNPLDESNMPQTIRARIRFVGLVCERAATTVLVMPSSFAHSFCTHLFSSVLHSFPLPLILGVLLGLCTAQAVQFVTLCCVARSAGVVMICGGCVLASALRVQSVSGRLSRASSSSVPRGCLWAQYSMVCCSSLEASSWLDHRRPSRPGCSSDIVFCEDVRARSCEEVRTSGKYENAWHCMPCTSTHP